MDKVLAKSLITNLFIGGGLISTILNEEQFKTMEELAKEGLVCRELTTHAIIYFLSKELKESGIDGIMILLNSL